MHRRPPRRNASSVAAVMAASLALAVLLALVGPSLGTLLPWRLPRLDIFSPGPLLDAWSRLFSWLVYTPPALERPDAFKVSREDATLAWGLVGALLPVVVGGVVAWRARRWRIAVLGSELRVLADLALGLAPGKESEAQATARAYLEGRGRLSDETSAPSPRCSPPASCPQKRRRPWSSQRT